MVRTQESSSQLRLQRHLPTESATILFRASASFTPNYNRLTPTQHNRLFSIYTFHGVPFKQIHSPTDFRRASRQYARIEPVCRTRIPIFISIKSVLWLWRQTRIMLGGRGIESAGNEVESFCSSVCVMCMHVDQVEHYLVTCPLS